MRKLRVGIDGFNLALKHGTGVATYGFALACALKRAGHRVEGLFGVDTGAERALREVVFYDRLAHDDGAGRTRARRRRFRRAVFLAAARPGLRIRPAEVPLTGRVETRGFAGRLPPFDGLWSAPRLFETAFRRFALYGAFTRVVLRDPPDIMHWTYPVPVEVVGARNVYTLHDLIPLRLPHTTLDVKRDYARIVRACADRADHICTVSEASRADIVAELALDPGRVTNTYQSSPVPPAIAAQSARENGDIVEGVLGLKPGGYFLFCAALEPKKNVGRLIEAYLSLRTETPLVVTGSSGWSGEEETRLLTDNPSPGVKNILRLDYLPRDLLLRVSRSARALVFPSLYEGFGLPVLEAIQLGTPVLTSDTSSLPEIVGDAGIMVDPYDVGAIAAGLRRLDEDADLRATLAARGPEQARAFSETRYVERLEAMYARVLATPA